MNKGDNVFLKIGNWIEEKNLLWFFPSRKETTEQSFYNTLIILLLIPCALLIILVRIVYLLLSLFFPNLLRKSNLSNSNIFKNLHLIKSLALSSLLALILSVSIYKLHHYSKSNNESLIEVRQYSELIPPIDVFLPNNFFFRYTYKAIYDACIQEHSSQSVMKLKKELCVDEDFAKSLHFKDPEGFSAFIYSLNGIDSDVSSYLSDVDKLDGFEELKYWYSSGAEEDYYKGNYYQASEKIGHYFNLYNNKKIFPLEAEKVNNEMHILKLLLQHRWALSTHREFADKALLSILEFHNDEDEYTDSNPILIADESYCAGLREHSFEELSGDNSDLKEIGNYFDGLSLFHGNSFSEAIIEFIKCFESTKDELLKQYCALMTIRSAFWQYDKNRDSNNLLNYKKMTSRFSKYISLQYFLPDLNKYNTIVERIQKDPEYDGY